MRGRIVKGIAGFYYVYADDGETYECKAKGVFRKDRRRPMVGDRVELTILSDGEKLGNITELLERLSETVCIICPSIRLLKFV